MLDGLFGSQSVRKIFFFLFVHEKCYGTQLQHRLKTPLTPLQKALTRLEKEGILRSVYEGKTRVYQWNPTYPLREELELLLQRAFSFLSAEEKQSYLSVPPRTVDTEIGKQATNLEIVLACWERLSSAKRLSVVVKTKGEKNSRWNREGRGSVHVEAIGEDILLFRERGSWREKESATVDFSNLFRWTLSRKEGSLSLEHLRYGKENPVFLFSLAPIKAGVLASTQPHICAADTYFGEMYYDHLYLRLLWRAIGPKKNESMDYYYWY